MHGLLTVNAAIKLILSARQQFSPAVASLLTGCGCEPPGPTPPGTWTVPPDRIV